jgi:ABC-2 type transport system permease protein
MNVYFQELKTFVRSAFNWTLAMLLTLTVFMFMFPAISKDIGLMNEILSNFPPEFTRALGLSTLDLSDVIGYYAYAFMYIVLIGSVYALKIGISVLSEETRVKTADFLLSKPISRTAIVTAKIMSVLTLLLCQTIIFIIGSLVITQFLSNQYVDKNTFLLITLSLLLVQLFFAAFGLLLSVIISKIKTVLPITLGVVFGFWALQMLNQSLEGSQLAYITPFAYFDPSQIIASGGYEPIYLGIDLTMIVIFTILTYVIYNKKDMPSV